jgi:SAM-dependent methyltransferase
MAIDYSTVTERAGDDISIEQINRLCHRYYWASPFCRNKDVIEVACGTGPGLGYLAGLAKSLRAGDYTESILSTAKQHYQDRIDLRQFDAQSMPYADKSADVILLYEAIYYLPNPKAFVQECVRILRPGGTVLVATANKDLYDFNPSPHSHYYFGTVEFNELFSPRGFSVECFGYLSVNEVSIRQRILRPVKRLAASLHLIPKTTDGKKWLKRIVFGGMAPMPAEISAGQIAYRQPQPLSLASPDREHKVIYCAATLPS